VLSTGKRKNHNDLPPANPVAKRARRNGGNGAATAEVSQDDEPEISNIVVKRVGGVNSNAVEIVKLETGNAATETSKRRRSSAGRGDTSLREEPDASNGAASIVNGAVLDGVHRGFRSSFPEWQLRVLHKELASGVSWHKGSHERRMQLASDFGCDVDRITNWFRNFRDRGLGAGTPKKRR